MSKRLREILTKNDLSERFLVAIPDCFGDLSQFNEKAQFHWRIRLDKERIKWVRCLNTKAPYYQAQITRFYFDWADKSQCNDWYTGLKNIWNHEDVLLVEGELSRVGVGNDLFDNAASIRRILCPAENAFDCYEKILETICKYFGIVLENSDQAIEDGMREVLSNKEIRDKYHLSALERKDFVSLDGRMEVIRSFINGDGKIGKVQ